jgi:hypothetical protein
MSDASLASFSLPLRRCERFVSEALEEKWIEKAGGRASTGVANASGLEDGVRAFTAL